MILKAEGFYAAAGKRIDLARAQDVVPENDRLLRTLRSMGRIMQADGKVEFRGETYAERFAEELRQRYGEGVVASLPAGQAEILAEDFGDVEQRNWIARAIVSAAKSHMAFGLTLRETCKAERDLAGRTRPGNDKDWDL